MAARRLNIKFVVILAAILLVLGLSALAMLHIQSSRQVEQCYQIGLAAFEKGDMAEARTNLGHVAEKLENEEARIDASRKMGLAYIDLLEQPNKSHNDIEICMAVFEKLLLMEASELGEDRVKFKEADAKCNLLLGKPAKAAQLYTELSNEFPDNPNFLLSASECYTRNRDSKASDTLSKLVSRHQDFIPGWIAYAQYYCDMDQVDLAMQTLNSMVDFNQESAQAYAQRSLFFYAHPELEQMAQAEESAVNAIRLDPNNVDALLAGVKMSINRKRFDQAREFMDKAKKIFKDSKDETQEQRLMELGIELADAEGQPENALELLEMGVKDDPMNITKRLQYFQRLIVTDKMEEAQKEINNLREIHHLPVEYLGFFEATIEIREEKWSSAVKKLEIARSFMGQQPELLAYIDRQRALCYGKLGQLDKEFDAFQKAIQNASEVQVVPFYIAYIHSLHTVGRIQQMEDVLMELMDKIGHQKFMEFHELRTLYFALLQQKEALKPKEEQNWDAINEAMKASSLDTNNPEGILLTVRMLVKQGNIKDAKDLLRRASVEHPDTVAFASYLALLEAQEKNYNEALSIIDTEYNNKKNNPGLLVTKVRILSQMKSEDPQAQAEVEKQFKQIEEIAYTLQDASKVALLKQIAVAWLQFENLEEADRVYTSIVQFEPENVGIKIQLFDLARKIDDEKKMIAQMERLRRELGPSAPEYRYCVATKALWEYGKKPDNPEKLRAAKEQLSIAQQLRPNWVYIPRAQAEIAIMEKDYNAAITYLNRVDQIGTLTNQQLNLLIRLLYLENRDNEVKQLVQKKREANLAVDAAMMSVEALANSGEGDEAVRRGSELIDPNNPKDYLWIGHIALRAKDYRKAEDAFKKVTEIAPDNPNGWLSLLQVQKIQNMEIDQQEFISKIRESVPQAKLPLCLAKAYQLFGDAHEAEKTFQQAVGIEPNNLEVLFSISQFYMCTTHPELAIPYLKKMSDLITADLRLNVDTKNQQLAWTRRSLAQVYGGMPNADLQNQGLQLVEENLSRQPDSLEDMKLKAMLLSVRHNPEDNQRAIEIFDNIPQLANRELFALAKLYYTQSFNPVAVSMKEKYMSVMTDLVASNENNAEYVEGFLEMLFTQNASADTINSYIGHLESLKGVEDPLVLMYRFKYLALTADAKKIKEFLKEKLPKEVTDKNAATLRKFAIALEFGGQTEEAAKLWTLLTSKKTEYIEDYMLYISRQQGFTSAFAYLQANQNKIDPRLQLNMIANACRHSKKALTRDEYKQIDEYIKVLFRDEPDVLEVKMFNAHVLTLHGKYDEAIAIYNALLNEPYTQPQLAAIENALAYLLALTGKDVARAVALVDEALAKYPHDTNLLDSQAVVYLCAKERSKIDRASENLKRNALTKNDAMCQFHLARMYWSRSNMNAAKIAFEEAKRLDPFLMQNIATLEIPDYTELTNNLE